MNVLQIIYRVYDEGMIVEELDETDEDEIQAQALPVYPIESTVIENSLPVH
jgi:hypothetical protein